MVFEPSGAWAPESLHTLKEIAKFSALRAGTEESVAVGALLQRLSVVIRTAGARAVIRRQALAAAGVCDPLKSAREALALQVVSADAAWDHPG